MSGEMKALADTCVQYSDGASRPISDFQETCRLCNERPIGRRQLVCDECLEKDEKRWDESKAA